MMVFLFRCLSWLPLPLLHNLGAAVGWVVWLVSRRYRRQMAENLATARLSFCAHAAIAENGKAVLELPRLWLLTPQETLRHVVQVSGWQQAELAAAAGRGVLFLTPHLGCFEIVGQYIASHMPMTALYRAPRQAWLESMMTAGRGASIKLAPADTSGVRRLLKALRAGEAVGMLPDQAPSAGEGLWAPFFGKPAYTMVLAARLAEISGATVLMIWAQRLAYGAGYHVHVLPLNTPLVGTLQERVTQINSEMERLIQQCPEQYFWGYNRYKRPTGAPAAPQASNEVIC